MRPLYDSIAATVKYNNEIETNCGKLALGLQTGHQDFLSFNFTTYNLTLTSNETTEPATFRDSRMLFSFMQLEFPVVINATFVPCKIAKLGFAKTKFSTDYEIGTDSVRMNVPDVLQEPNCNKVFDTFSLVSMTAGADLNSTVIESTLEFDSQLKQVVIKNTRDYRLAGKQVKVEIAID